LAYDGKLGTNMFLVLATADEDKPMLSCYISKEVADKKLNAGQVVRELGKYIQGGGGATFLCYCRRKKCRRYSRGIKQGSRVREVLS
jgi:alanyl-tRNA synthetase